MGSKRKHSDEHAEAIKRTRASYYHMVARCHKPEHVKFHAYGARGISVCDRWRTFRHFLADMGLRPEGKTIDRFPDRAGNYEPGNCRWATAQEQINNRSVHAPSHELDGEIVSVAAAGRKAGIPRNTLAARMKRYGCTLKEAIELPPFKSRGDRVVQIQTRSAQELLALMSTGDLSLAVSALLVWRKLSHVTN